MTNLSLDHHITGARTLILSSWVRWLLAGMAVGILLMVGYAIRQPSDTGVSTVEGFYSPNVQYGPWYLANHQTLFDSQQGVPFLSNYTSGLRYGAINFTYTYLNGAALILSGTTDAQAIGWLYLVSPWQGLLLLPLCALTLYGWACRATGSSFNPAASVVLYAFAALPNYPMISWAGTGGYATPLGWALFLGIYLAILARNFEQHFSWQWALMMVICLLLLQPTYHTAAMALTISLVSLWVIQQGFVTKALTRFTQSGRSQGDLAIQPYLRSRSVQLTIVVFLSFLLYHAVLLFNDYGRIFFRFLSDIYRSDDHERLKYSMTGTGISIWWHILNYLAVIAPIAWIGMIALRRRFQAPRDAALSFYPLTWILALMPMIMLLYAWDGGFGVFARLLQYGTLLAIASAALLLALRPQALKAIALTTAICVACSIGLTMSLNVSASNNVTNDELAAMSWIRSERGCDAVLFTDFRIATTMGYQGCFAVVGPTAGNLSRQNMIDQISVLLYDGDPARLSTAIDRMGTTDKRQANTLLISRRFLNESIGFVLPDTRLKPMTPAQWEAYRAIPGWKLAYENGTSMVLVRQ